MDTIDILAHRLDTLERRHRSHRRFNLVLLSALVVTVCCAARQAFTDGVVVRDSRGRDRVGMWVDQQDERHVITTIMDSKGLQRHGTYLERDGRVHSVYRGSGGNDRIVLGVDANDRVYMRILDAQGNVIRDLTR